MKRKLRLPLIIINFYHLKFFLHWLLLFSQKEAQSLKFTLTEISLRPILHPKRSLSLKNHVLLKISFKLLTPFCQYPHLWGHSESQILLQYFWVCVLEEILWQLLADLETSVRFHFLCVLFVFNSIILMIRNKALV